MHHLRSVVGHHSVVIHRIILKLSGDADGAVGVVEVIPRHVVGHRVLIALRVDFSVGRVHGPVAGPVIPGLGIPDDVVSHVPIEPQRVSVAVESDALLRRVVNPLIRNLDSVLGSC